MERDYIRMSGPYKTLGINLKISKDYKDISVNTKNKNVDLLLLWREERYRKKEKGIMREKGKCYQKRSILWYGQTVGSTFSLVHPPITFRFSLYLVFSSSRALTLACFSSLFILAREEHEIRPKMTFGF